MQINRLFEIVYILLEKGKVTAKELGEHFEVSARTIYRDVETLSGAGIPVYMSKGKGGGIFLLSDFVLNKAVITEAEKEEILSALNATNEIRSGEGNTAFKKLESLFGKTNSDWLEVDFGMWSDGEKEESLFRDLKQAILEKKTVRFAYASAKGELTEREVEPLKLCFKGEAWYLYAYCRNRKDNRFFKLKRMRGLHITEEGFQRECREKVLKRVQMPLETETVTLQLQIAEEAAFRVYEEFENYRRLEDGSFLVEITLPKNGWLPYYLMSFGTAVSVLEPEEIRTQMKAELERILGKYS